MIAKLHEITEIKTGITFRNRLLDNLDGEIEVIQMKDVEANHTISERLIRISAETIKPKHLLQPGHIVLLAKGKYTSACLITPTSRKRVISSAFFSLKVKHPKLVLPHYLQWYLNQPAATHYFKSNASGTSMFSLPMSVLKNLEVPVPSVTIQEKLVKMVELRTKEKVTLQQLEEEKDRYIQQLLIHHVYQA